MAARALLFDLDGTIWDSIPLYAAVINLFGGPTQDVTIRKLLDGGNVASLLRSLGIGEKELDTTLRGRKVSLELYPDVPTCLADLNAADIPVGFVTSLPGWIWRPLVSGSRLRTFATSIEGWRRAHPKHAAIRSVLNTLSVSSGTDVWYIGDRDVDGIAARKAGVSFAWASWGYSSRIPANACRQLYSFIDVLAL